MPRTGYVDRKVLIQYPNGGVGEVQIIPRGMYEAKQNGGHELYTLARSASTPRGQAELFTERMNAMYSTALAGTEFGGMGV